MKRKHKNRMFLTYWLALILFLMLMYFFFHLKKVKAQLINPVNEKAPKVVVVDLPNIYKPDGPIEEEIYQVFGSYWPKARLLLKGNGPQSCHENGSLNPKAFHDNTKDATPGKGRDYGVFQINDEWQGITNKEKAKQFLFDQHINIRIAYRLFVDSGYNFSLWTCGKAYGI